MGMSYIAHLVQRAYNDEPEIHALDLYNLVNGHPPVTSTDLNRLPTKQLAEYGLVLKGPDDGLEVITTEGKKRIKGQVRELEQQIKELQEIGNLDEVYQLRETKEALEDHLALSYGASGRARKVGSKNEQMRQTVSKNIGNAIAHINKENAKNLAAYLKDRCKSGNFFSFRKDPLIHWIIVHQDR